jgi:hypothetical protein
VYCRVYRDESDEGRYLRMILVTIVDLSSNHLLLTSLAFPIPRVDNLNPLSALIANDL